MGAPENLIVWAPQPGPQTDLLQWQIFETFYGGARGGGKTDGVLGEWVQHASMYGELASGLMVRRHRTELYDTIERSRQLYTRIGATFNETEKLWRFPGGARLRFAYLENDGDAEMYQGHSYTRVYVEEAGNFPNIAPVLKLMATLRSAHGVACRFIATGNPGGPGHGWVKARYINPAPRGRVIIEDSSTSMERCYIPARVSDNAALLAADPGYVNRLKASGSPELVRAWLEGDWDVVAGAYFPEFSRGRHVLEPMEFPSDWRRFTATDWGSARPFWTGWFVVVQREMQARTVTGRPVTLLPNALVCYREWYGEDKDRPGQNLGIKLPVEEWALGVLKRSKDEEIDYDVADTSMFQEDGGPSQAERAMKIRHKGKKLRMRPADKKRLPGWNQVRARLRGDVPDEKGEPMLFFLMHCEDAIRTLAALQHDDVESKFEDAETEGEDHAPDGIRYGCMSRPRKLPDPADRFAHLPKKGTMEWLTSEAWKGRPMPGLSRRTLG